MDAPRRLGHERPLRTVRADLWSMDPNVLERNKSRIRGNFCLFFP
jgi:hypothetical protein